MSGDNRQLWLEVSWENLHQLERKRRRNGSALAAHAPNVWPTTPVRAKGEDVVEDGSKPAVAAVFPVDTHLSK